MESRPSTFALNCGHGHTAQCVVALADEGGWDVEVKFDGNIVLTKRCSEWHRVERLCDQIQRQCPCESKHVAPSATMPAE